MGMTIEEAILYMELYKRNLLDSVSDLDKDIEAYDTAIDTMRKYQKIKEIVRFGNANELGFEYVGEKITEVIEDDNSVVDNSSMRSDPGNTEHCSDSGAGKEQQEPSECIQ